MKNVKSFLKVFVIIALVVAAIGGTVYFFFTHLHVKPDSYNEVQAYLNGSEKTYLADNITTVNNRATQMGNSNLKTLIFANKKMDAVADDLILYYIVNKNYDFDEFAINDNLNLVKANGAQLTAVTEEFIDKDKKANFPADEGANDVLKSYAKYLVSYANLLISLNNNVEAINISKTSNVKFSMYDLFLNVCLNTFGEDNLIRPGKYVNLKESDNLTTIIGSEGADRFKIENSILVFAAGNFTKYNNLFVKYYNGANKKELFSKFASFVGSANSEISEEKSNEQNTAACFKILYGV